jgi:hypothetical protein
VAGEDIRSRRVEQRTTALHHAVQSLDRGHCMIWYQLPHDRSASTPSVMITTLCQSEPPKAWCRAVIRCIGGAERAPQATLELRGLRGHSQRLH